MAHALSRFVPADPARRAAALSFVSNLVLMVIKIAAGLVSGSVAVLSDGLDSAQDSVAAGITFASVAYGARPPDLHHPYGHGRAETIAAGIQSVVIATGGAYIIYRGIGRLMDPPDHIDTGLGLGVMLLAAVVNFGVSRYSFSVAKLTGSPAITSDARHLMTNVVQALGVLVGLALVAITGKVRIDAVIALAIGVYVLWVAGSLLWASIGDVLDASLSSEDVALVEQTVLREGDKVAGFHRLRTRRSGQQPYVDLHLLLEPTMTVLEAHEIMERIEARIEAVWPNANVTIHTEPDDGRFRGPLASGGDSRGREGESKLH